MLGILLFIIGAIMVFFALVGIFSYILEAVFAIVFTIIRAIFDGVYHLFNRNVMISDDYRRHMEEQKIAKETAERAKKEARKEKELKEANDRYMYSIKRRVNDLKMKYPLADNTLFDEFVTAYTTRTIQESKDIADMIQKQHETRLKERSFYNKNTKYTVDEVLFFNKVDERVSYDMHCTIYKNGADYILLIINTSTNEKTLYVSKNPLVTKRITISVVNERDKREKKFIMDKRRKDNRIMTVGEVSDIISYTVNEIMNKN